MGQRVQDGGESEGHSVIERIGVKLGSDITLRESEQTSAGDYSSREHLANRLRGESR